MPVLPPIPFQIAQQGNRLLAALSPSARAWGMQQTRQIASGPGFGLVENMRLREAIRPRFSGSIRAAGQDLSGSAMDALRFALLFQTLKLLDEAGIMEENALHFQLLMERRAKIIQTLSNIMKGFAQTQEQIIQNLK